jgi:outer membrane protein
MNLMRLLILFLILVSFKCFTQNIEPEKRKLSLQEVIEMARSQSLSSLQASTIRENRYWQWRTYKSNYLPQLMLRGSLPDYKKSNLPTQQPDGTISFRPAEYDYSTLNLGLSQSIGLTGGQISINSDLTRFYNFYLDSALKRNGVSSSNYLGSPANIVFNQPLFNFNKLKWDRKIEPLKYEESQKKYWQDLENISKDACTLFFQLLISQINREIAEKNKHNNDTIFKISEVRFRQGKISKNELLQVKLSVVNAQKAAAQARLSVETTALQLKTFIGYTERTSIELKVPLLLPDFRVEENIALEQAKKNRQEALAFKRAMLEAERDVAQAKGTNGLNANLVAAYGFTNTSDEVFKVYKNPGYQQLLQIGFQIPLLDWGRSNSIIKTSKANAKFTEYAIRQQEINFEQEIIVQVKQFNMLREQMELNKEADSMALERYEISKSKYMIGNLNITDLHIALLEKDQAKRDFINALMSFWDAYYNMRALTLYDFEKNEPIIRERNQP